MRVAATASFHRWLSAGFLLVSLAPVHAADGVYQVRRGDTLGAIAATCGTSIQTLAGLNGIAPETTLQFGQTLKLPAVTASYQVQAGDNLYRIAERFGVAVEALTVANDLTPKSILQIGQTLRLPGAGGTPPAAVVAPTREAPQVETARVALAAPAGDDLPALVWVAEARVHLRRGPSTLKPSVGLLSQGAKLKVLGKSGMWWKVVQPGSGEAAWVAGWVVSRREVDAAAPPVSAPSGEGESICVGYALEPRVNVRAAADIDSERVAVAVRGTPMDVLKIDDGWLRVRFENGTVGWIARHLVRMPNGGDAGASGASAAGGELVQTAMSFLGSPYRRGGTSRGGVDCSGLVYAVCRQHGIKLPRTSRDMFGHGQSVSRGNLQPGDLVFFKNTYRSGISHVGIYVGESKFVHAVRPGRGVAVSSLSEGYYSARWAGAYRVTD